MLQILDKMNDQKISLHSVHRHPENLRVLQDKTLDQDEESKIDWEIGSVLVNSTGDLLTKEEGGIKGDLRVFLVATEDSIMALEERIRIRVFTGTSLLVVQEVNQGEIGAHRGGIREEEEVIFIRPWLRILGPLSI